MKYAELLRENAVLAETAGTPLSLAVLANITIAPIKEVLEFAFRSRGLNARVTIGRYDNVAQDSQRLADYDAVFVFFELAGLSDRLPFETHVLDSESIGKLIDKAKGELAFTFEALSHTGVVVFNLLCSLPFTLRSPRATALDYICQEVNAFVRANAPKSFKLIELEKIFAGCPVREAIDLRMFLAFRSLYSIAFLRAYAELVYPLVAVTAGRYKKALVLDCDGTLWKGVVGEDGVDGIVHFREVQSFIVQLAEAGVLVCLCSKNEVADVERALADPRAVLREEHLVMKVVNWRDKAANLREIASTLNLGLESFVFVDDSDFEIECVRCSLPAVSVFKASADYTEYLWSWQTIASLFYRESDTAEDRVRAQQYKVALVRRQQHARFADLDAYLRALDLSLRLSLNTVSAAPRLAQLTQKTNQFNLMTNRMSESQMISAMQSPDWLVVGVEVSDRFGSYGIVGLIMARQAGSDASIENFLLSCRVIGRNVELKAFDFAVDRLRARGVTRIVATYRATPRNGQVSDLYERLGFGLVREEGASKHYQMDIDAYRPSSIDYIRVEHA